MKKLILPLLVMTAALGSCNMANEDDYKNLATDMCDCVNKNVTGLSPEVRDIYVKYAEDPNEMQTKMQEYYMNHMDAAAKDMAAMEKVGENIDKCVEKLEKKYEDLYTSDDKKEVENKIVKILATEKGCELTHALFTIASREGNQ